MAGISQLHQERELVILRADLTISSPESYSIEEMKQISGDLDDKTESLEDAIRVDFNLLSEIAQNKLHNMFVKLIKIIRIIRISFFFEQLAI